MKSSEHTTGYTRQNAGQEQPPIIGWDPTDVHVAAYAGYPDVQKSIRSANDDGGVGRYVMPALAEVAA